MEVKLNGVTRAFGRAILVGALLWTGQASAQFGPPGFGPPGGGDFRRDYDRGRDSDRSRDSDRDRDRDSSSRSSSSGSSSHQSTSTVTTPGHTRVTMGLQATYADVDTNHDGQLIMAEWKKAKKPLAQFNQLDINKDGFLTPRELERAGSMPAIPSNSSIASGGTPGAAGSPTAGSPVASTTPSTSSPPKFVSKLTEDEQAKADELQAKNLISFLDKNRDGKIAADEVAGSKTIGPLFQQAGINFSEPMPTEQFVSNYVRIQKSKRT